jgi:hypothetical protein
MNDAFEFEFDDGSVTRLARLFGVQPATAVSEPDRLVAVLRRAGVGARNTSGLSPASS